MKKFGRSSSLCGETINAPLCLHCIASLALTCSSRVQRILHVIVKFSSHVAWLWAPRCACAAGVNVEHRLIVPLTSLIMAATISKGTLGLRFMQNAQRAERGLETNSTDAEPVIQDESHWEVSREVKEMWGMTSEASSSSSRHAATPLFEIHNLLSL